MDLETSKDKFIHTLSDYRIDEIENIIKICSALSIPKKILCVVIYNFYLARSILWVEPDDIVLYTSIIDISYKEMDGCKSQEIILQKCLLHFLIDATDEELELYKEHICEFQLNFLYLTKCDLTPPNPYDEIEKIYNQHEITKELQETTTTFLNDLAFFMPSVLYFTPYECACACIYLTFLLKQKDFYTFIKQNEEEKDTDKFFENTFDLNNETVLAVNFLSNELLVFYEKNCEYKK